MVRTAALLSVLALVACSKTEGTGPGTAGSATAAVTASAPASAAASATASAAATASATASAAASASAEPVAKAAGSGAAPASSNPSGAGECGKSPLPDCPLQGWMKQNMTPPTNAGDAAGIAAALEKSVAFAPPGYTNWASIAKDGAKAAKGGDIPAAKQSCRTCHDQYKAKYKAEMRTRKI